ncbi:CDT1-like protein b [Phragmites australis]|uniref:CDT1-like protein b n=1 Tax=Phragmites australis TaxID=29695 RepID=UPI002D79B800|nr:CDT1-like protein b [Phragmites australis]
MSEGNINQLDLEKGLPQMSNDNDSSSPATIQKMKVDTEGSGSKIESPTPEKPESRRKGVVVSSLARNLLAERYKDKFADQLWESEDETDDEDYNDNVSPGGSQYLISGSTLLLERHKNLLNLFNRMESSIRLLRMRKKMTTFKNIATQVEVLTKRKFLFSHLAQMKHLFPEAIQIKRILLHDEKSLCMYADMEITLVMDAVECRSPDQSPSMAICEAFYSKLLSFLDAHPKDIDIPEAILPELFSSRDKLYLEALTNGDSAEPPLQSSTENGFSNASHFPQSFQKLISQKIVADGTEKTQLLSDPAELSSLSAHDTEGPNRSPKKQDKHVPVPVQSEISATPNRHLISCCQESTPKQGTSDSPLMAETPAMQTPKRPLPTPLDKLETTCGHISEPRSASSARRSLMYSPLKFEGSPSYHDVNTAKLEVTSKKGLFSEEASTFTNSLEENDPVCLTGEDKINQGPGETQEKLACLRVTFDIVWDFSTKNSLITKQELFHYILANNLEIEETGEIEEQLHILEDLAPDWISKKVIQGGEILYSIEQIPDRNSVRARLVEAI